MSELTIQENILNALAGTSSQMPVNLGNLQSLLKPKVKSAELEAALEVLCQSRQLQTCSGFKDGQEYVCYWIPGNIPSKSPPLY